MTAYEERTQSLRSEGLYRFKLFIKKMTEDKKRNAWIRSFRGVSIMTRWISRNSCVTVLRNMSINPNDFKKQDHDQVAFSEALAVALRK